MQGVQNNKEPIYLCSLYFILVTHTVHVALLDIRLEVLVVHIKISYQVHDAV
jgi:hypothetical protein